MDQPKAQEILDKIVAQIFGVTDLIALETFKQKYAFDVQLPNQVSDALTHESTWSQSTNPSQFMRIKNIYERANENKWEQPNRQLGGIEDILHAWAKINFTATEWQVDSMNVVESDNIYASEYVYRSQDVDGSKHIIFCDGLRLCEYLAASQRNVNCQNCIRAEDSDRSSNCFSISRCSKVTNSFFMHNCQDMSDCMFCSHISGKRYCIANIQFEVEEYNKLKKEVIHWILTS